MKRIGFLIALLAVGPLSAADLRLKDENGGGPAPWRGMKNPEPEEGNYALPTGFIFEAILETAIFSYNVATPVTALVDEDVVYLGQVVIPRGSRLIGEVQVLHSGDRVNVGFHTCVFPNGQETRMPLLALSLDGSAGIRGKVKKHKDAVAARIAMRSVFTGVQAAAAVGVPTVEKTALVGMTDDAMQTLDSPNVKVLESITVQARTAIKLFCAHRVTF